MCRACGQVWIGIQKINLPESISEAMIDLAEGANESAVEAREGMEAGTRIERWFASVYQRGYMHGFFRALAYAKHHAKEGRLIRLRKLWGGASHDDEATYIFPENEEKAAERTHVVRMSADVYNEVETLLDLRFGVKLDAKSSEDADPSG